MRCVLTNQIHHETRHIAVEWLRSAKAAALPISGSSVRTCLSNDHYALRDFSADRIHPFAYAVNTFLQPALDDCRALLRSNPQDTFNILLSLTQTFIRFAPDAELIYDDIQQFAGKRIG